MIQTRIPVMPSDWAGSGTFGRASETVVTPTAYRSPGYPWLLSWLVVEHQLWIPGVAALHVCLGAVTCLLTHSIAKRINDIIHGCPGEWFVGCLDPILVRQAALVMTETLATCLGSRCLVDLDRGLGTQHHSPLALYGLPGRATGDRCSRSPLVTCVVAHLVRFDSHEPDGESIRSYRMVSANVTLIACMILGLVPWAVRNHRVMGSTIWTTTHGGYTLLLATTRFCFVITKPSGLHVTGTKMRFIVDGGAFRR